MVSTIPGTLLTASLQGKFFACYCHTFFNLCDSTLVAFSHFSICNLFLWVSHKWSYLPGYPSFSVRCLLFVYCWCGWVIHVFPSIHNFSMEGIVCILHTKCLMPCLHKTHLPEVKLTFLLYCVTFSIVK